MISAIVLTKNEEKNIKECLCGLKWCDETIIIDDNSSDKTVEIVKKEGAKVFLRQLDEDFGEQRNFALKKANFDWVLFVDGDERVSQELADEIQKAMKLPGISGFYFKRTDNFLGKWLKHGEVGHVRLLRLARRGSGEWQRKVDEVWHVSGKTKILRNPLYHYSHQDLSSFLQSINERSTLNAKVFYEEGKKLTIFEWEKPFLKFIKNYFLLFGFFDGSAGFVFAILMSLHSFLVRAKLYLLWKRGGK